MRFTQGEKLEMVKFLLDDLKLYKAIADVGVEGEELALEHDFLEDKDLSVSYAAVARAELLHTLSYRNKLPTLTKEAYALIDFWIGLRDALAKEAEANDT